MLGTLHRHILLPLFETGIKRRKTFPYWGELERSQWLRRAELEQRQFIALRDLVRHAFSYCPYYRQKWQSQGVHPNRLGSPADFTAWPITTREDIRSNRLEMRATRSDLRLIAKSTGGSSGVPLQFDLDTDSNDRRMAAWHRGYSWAGAGPGSKQFYLWGADARPKTRWKNCKDRLYNQLYRKRVWSSFDLSERRVPVLLDDLNRCRPDAIVAYTKPLHELARFLDERDIRPFSPRSIVVGAEKLHDFERDVIEHVFRAPVFETYGSREFMLIGAECERHCGLHLTMENLLVEILDADGRPTPSGEEGDVVVTDLYNRGMPFIRYASGDRAVAGFAECPCGRGLPLLSKVVGRQLDILRTPDGRMIPGEFFPHLLKDYRAVRRFQVVQESMDLVRLCVVTDAAWKRQTKDKLTELIQKQLGPHVRFELCLMDEIPLTASGKMQVVINRVSHRRAA